jgi:hypothetical protein
MTGAKFRRSALLSGLASGRQEDSLETLVLAFAPPEPDLLESSEWLQVLLVPYRATAEFPGRRDLPPNDRRVAREGGCAAVPCIGLTVVSC